jgi:hypothetical protein
MRSRRSELVKPDPVKIFAVSLLTGGEWQSFGTSLQHALPLPTDNALEDLVREIGKKARDADRDPMNRP